MMKVVAKPIEVIAWFDDLGVIHPIRFKLKGEEDIVVKIGRVLRTDLEKLAGNKMYVFTCTSIINGMEKIYEIKYDLGKCNWILFKI